MWTTKISSLKSLAGASVIKKAECYRDRCKSARTLLKELEWEGGLGPNEDDRCPMCKYENTKGHAPDCKLKELIG